jgi:two-component system KDP operon response regulator KdpE
MMIRALLVSGDGEATQLLSSVLAGEGFNVSHAECGQRALACVRDTQTEVILIDTPLKDVDGLELCRRLRDATDAPIVLMAPDAREADIVRALELGADEYVLRPLRPRELAARLRALLRRTNGQHAGVLDGRLTLGDLEANLDERRVYRHGRLVELSPIEFRLLVCLLREAGRVVTHRKLMAQVWGGQYVDCRHYLRLYVGYLRSKLEDDPRDPKLILNEWGIGYRLVASASPGP